MSLTPFPIAAIDGFYIGHWTNSDAGTGCTAIVCPNGASGGVDIRGGAPATRETDLLRPEQTVNQVHAVMLSGGSLFGLEAASGAAAELERRGIGLDTGIARAPIVVAASLFDLAFADSHTRPNAEAGTLAVCDALDQVHTEVLEGNIGAGTGATVGKLLGPKHVMKAGLGARAFALDELQIGAIAAVNACGNVFDPSTHQVLAGVRKHADSTEILDMEELMLERGTKMSMPLERMARSNTTISCIITNAELTKAEATKLAQMAADAYAHCIRPTHTTNDGDAIFVLASGTLGKASAVYPLDLMGLIATRSLEAALVAGVKCAHTSHGIVGYASLHHSSS
ncbi:P1 family peptidase [Collinsella sp. zg1085]|uniref:P1 family peptidase n=1 Tax=Collinsella sp. zg1085 TaxID=2844380 RepID=UPI001C0CC604|nr:P1 family peptidase [Collinsella sp. zg1085]QWT18008.1 P1 family peptidase [Collinsella sp. zg1085]